MLENILVLIKEHAHLLPFYLPLGIIGIWRWSVWLFRRIVSFFYRPPEGTYDATLSIITPVYNENPETFQLALYSWEANRPDEIIAVIDHTDKTCIEIFERFSRNFSGARLIVTEKPGKRPALADGVRAADGEIVALVDSDTIWDSDIKGKLLGTFADPEVGGLVTRQGIIVPDTMARRLFKILLDDRYLLEYPFLAVVSDAILCISGRTAVYRRSAIIDELDMLENETFWGKKMISGDDKTLTNLIHAKGWKSRYLKNAKVYTVGAAGLSSYLKQKLRWARNGLRSDSRVLASGWVWKNHKMLALHMLDKLVSPVTLLLGLAYFFISLYLHHWTIALLIAAWWIISRLIKIFPHLREKPADILILPVYVVMTFVIAIIKIYALITIDKQDWITRWDNDRRKRFTFLENLCTYLATASIVYALFFFVYAYKEAALRWTPLHSGQTAQKKTPSILTPGKDRPSDTDLKNTETAMLAANRSDRYGYYVIKTGDTLPLLRKRFNLSPTGKILDADSKQQLGRLAPLAVGKQIAIPVDDLRNPLDQKTVLAGAYFSKPARITYDATSNTIFAKQAGGVVTLPQISRSLGLAGRKSLEQTAPGEWMLRANLYIGKDVTLLLTGVDVKYLKLKSGTDGFVWLRCEGGSVLISQTKITSWDEQNNGPDLDYEDGRSYITAKNSWRMDILDSELAYLGFTGGDKRGGAFGGSYGVSWKIKSKSIRDRLTTGVVRNNLFHDNYFGAYTFGVTGMLFQQNEFYDNIQYGLDPHDDSNNMLIENNRSFHNGNHGIILSKRCVNNIITNNLSFENRLHGIMLDRQSNNNLVSNNTVYGDTDGITIYQSDKNIILDNTIRDNKNGIRINASGTQNFFARNTLLRNIRGIYVYGGSSNNSFLDNGISESQIGITLKNADQNLIVRSLTPSNTSNKKDGRVTKDSHDNIIQ